MKRFAIHNTGDWVRNDYDTAATREPATVTEYDTLDQIPKADRWAFDWMLEQGELCISCGATVYQVRKGVQS